MKILSCNYQPHALGRQTSERGAFLFLGLKDTATVSTVPVVFPFFTN